jgi:hypothetical protein
LKLSPQHTRLLKELDLLTRCGLGLALMAPSLAPLVRQLVGARACVIVWLDDQGWPLGMFHENALASTTELFLNDYQQLFSGEAEKNASWLARNGGSPVARLLRPDADYYRSNSYNLLVKPDSYHHVLDLTVQVDGVARAVVALFKSRTESFTDADAKKLLGLLPFLQRAAVKSASLMPAAVNGSGQTGHLLVSADGARIESISEAGVALLRSAHLVGHGVQLIGPMVRPPLFVRQLCENLRTRRAASLQSLVEIPGSSLHCSATWMGALTKPDANHVMAEATGPLQPSNILVTLERQPPMAIQLVRNVAGLDLSPLQSRVAFFAAQGGSRADCAAHHRVSKEALKKHLSEIYAAADCDSWGSLTNRLTQHEGRMQ